SSDVCSSDLINDECKSLSPSYRYGLSRITTFSSPIGAIKCIMTNIAIRTRSHVSISCYCETHAIPPLFTRKICFFFPGVTFWIISKKTTRTIFILIQSGTDVTYSIDNKCCSVTNIATWEVGLLKPRIIFSVIFPNRLFSESLPSKGAGAMPPHHVGFIPYHKQYPPHI